MDVPTRTKSPLAGPVLVYGFAATVAMWIAGFITHHPGVHLRPVVPGVLLIFILLAVCIFAGGTVDARRSWKVGLGTGLLAAILNLLVLGSYLVDPEASNPGTPKPSAAMEAGGFLLVGAVVGVIGGLLGIVLERIFSAKRKELIIPAAEPDWLARFGLVAVAAVVPLLIIGGWVTSSQSGLAVPDWPGTYAANMFLYPIGLMTRPRIFLEHSHRLFGALTGLTTLVLMLYTLLGGEKRRWMKIFAVILFVLVVVQGVLGGFRVEDKSTLLALVHGVVAQLFFALLVAFAACLSPAFKNPDYPRGVITSRRPKIVTTALLHTTIVQLILGGVYRHLGSPHALFTHIGFSLIVVVFAILASIEVQTMLRTQPDHEWIRLKRSMKALGIALMVCIIVQFSLGWMTLFTVGMKKGKPELPFAEEAAVAAQPPLLEQLMPTLHQANGALLLGLATLAYVWVLRLWRRAPRA